MKMPSLLFGLGGYAGVGKDAFADALVEFNDFNKQFMSSPLRQALLTVDPWILGEDKLYYRYSAYEEIVKSYEAAKRNPEVRRLLQVLGTEVGRNMFGQNVWVDLLDNEVKKLRANDISVVVTGIRYRNELDWVLDNGGHSIWIERPGVEPVNSHSSDNTLSMGDFDIMVSNEGTLGELADSASALVRALHYPLGPDL